MKHPCSDMCVTYAICRQKELDRRFYECVIFADYVRDIIDNSEIKVPEKYHKGTFTVVAIKPEGEEKYIDKAGNVFSCKFDCDHEVKELVVKNKEE